MKSRAFRHLSYAELLRRANQHLDEALAEFDALNVPRELGQPPNETGVISPILEGIARESAA